MRRHEEHLRPEQVPKLRTYLTDFPIREGLYDFKQELTAIMRRKKITARRAKRVIPDFLFAIECLKDTPIPTLQTLGATLESWKDEIRFRRDARAEHDGKRGRICPTSVDIIQFHGKTKAQLLAEPGLLRVCRINVSSFSESCAGALRTLEHDAAPASDGHPQRWIHGPRCRAIQSGDLTRTLDR
jgi:hypothetical protein